jgi:hypothetical protein
MPCLLRFLPGNDLRFPQPAAVLHLLPHQCRAGGGRLEGEICGRAIPLGAQRQRDFRRVAVLQPDLGDLQPIAAQHRHFDSFAAGGDGHFVTAVVDVLVDLPLLAVLGLFPFAFARSAYERLLPDDFAIGTRHQVGSIGDRHHVDAQGRSSAGTVRG